MSREVGHIPGTTQLTKDWPFIVLSVVDSQAATTTVRAILNVDVIDSVKMKRRNKC